MSVATSSHRPFPVNPNIQKAGRDNFGHKIFLQKHTWSPTVRLKGRNSHTKQPSLFNALKKRGEVFNILTSQDNFLFYQDQDTIFSTMTQRQGDVHGEIGNMPGPLWVCRTFARNAQVEVQGSFHLGRSKRITNN